VSYADSPPTAPFYSYTAPEYITGRYLPISVATTAPLLDNEVLEMLYEGNVQAVTARCVSDPTLIQAVDVNSSATAVHWAALLGHLPVVRELHRLGARMDVGAAASCMQPIHWAVVHGHLDVLQFLIEEVGVSAHAVDVKQTTPLMIAAQYNHTRCIFYLGRQRPDTLHLVDHDSDSAMHWAAYKDSLQCLSMLCSFGLDPAVQDKFGSTALHLAVSRRARRSVKWLLGHEAAPRMMAALDSKGRTPVTLAAEGGDSVVISLVRDFAERLASPEAAGTLYNRALDAEHSLLNMTLFTWNHALEVTESIRNQATQAFGISNGHHVRASGASATPVAPMAPAME
jgi:ankyrin repeat protein